MISPFEGGTRRRHRRGRRLRRRLATLLAVLVPIAGVALAWYLLADNGGAITGHSPAVASSGAAVKKASPPASAPARRPGSPEAVALESSDAFQLKFKDPPSAALVFDVNSGRVLWRLNPLQTLPIASITKLMTALLVAEDTKNSDQVLITPDALHYSGSGVGLLPKGRHVTVKALLYGLLLPSGNDAAIALADHVAHTQPRFVAMMNAKAQALGLKCTHYVSPHGLEPGNRSCAADLATLSRIVLRTPAAGQHRPPGPCRRPLPDQGRQAVAEQHQPAAAGGLSGHDRPEDRRHRRGRALLHSDREARLADARRGASAFAESAEASP